MAEREDIFSSKINYDGIFNFKEFYGFCYEWLRDETGLDLSEEKYEEKIKGETKDISVEWKGSKKFDDYFKFEMKISFKVKNLKEVEVTQAGVKIKTNTGSVEVNVKGALVRDYQDRFEGTPFKKFLREAYEKWVISSRILSYKDKVADQCDNFLGQAKSYLDLEGKK